MSTGIRDPHLLNEIKALLLKRQISKTDEYDEDILSHFMAIFNILAECDYQESRSIRSRFYDLIEFYHDDLWIFLFILTIRQVELTGVLPIYEINLQVNNTKDSEQVFDYLMGLLNIHNSRGANRLSSDLLASAEIAEEYREPLFSMISDLAQHDNNLFNYDETEFVGIIAALSIGRKIAHLIDKVDYFYAILMVTVQKLHLTGKYQLVRDFCEEILYTSTIDKRSDWGHLISFVGMNAHFNANWALIYANMCLATIRKIDKVPDILLKRLLIGLQRFYRNYLFFDYSESIYHHMLTRLPLTWEERFDITNTHFHVLLKKKDLSLITEIYEFLVMNREHIYQGGKSVALPLLNTVYQTYYHFDDNVDKNIFNEYIQALEMIVGVENAQRIRLMTYADAPAIKQLFKEKIQEIQNTRSSDDLVAEIRDFIVIADRLIEYAYRNNDHESYLLGMIIKSDYSWVFMEKSLDDNYFLLKATSSVNLLPFPQQAYQDYVATALGQEKNDEFLWLAESKGQIFTLSLLHNTYTINHIPGWKKPEMDLWLNSIHESLFFDETVNRNGQVEQYLESDQLEDQCRIKEELRFASLDRTVSNSVIVIKDMDMSGFPHNLILDKEGTFISSYKPVTCVPSVEWIIEKMQADTFLENSCTSSLWIPTDSGDMALNLLWSRLDEAIRGYNINVQNSIAPSAPLSSEINILISHGARDISTSHNISVGDGQVLVNTHLLVSRGCILILFICHSGSMSKALFRDKVMSLIRQYFQAGYLTIIAPLWSLHISIPPIWLPAFFNAIQKGNTVAEAVYKANMAVYNINKNPGAWACLHLYGNPYLKIKPCD